MTKLEQLKEMLKKWRPSRSITVAYDVCDFLYKNLDMGDEKSDDVSSERG